MINGQRTIKELCDDSEDDPFHVYRLLYGLRANKLIEVGGRSLPRGHWRGRTVGDRSPRRLRDRDDDRRCDDAARIAAIRRRVDHSG